METTPVTGTTWAILAPYLLHGVEVVDIGFTIQSTYSIKVVNMWPTNPCMELLRTSPKASSEVDPQVEDEVTAYLGVEQVLPLLYAFDDIVKPMADGKVPAVEVAKYATLWGRHEGQSEPVVIDNGHVPVHPVIVSIAGEGIVKIFASGDTQCIDAKEKPEPSYNQAAILDYLRSKHIAVDLTAAEYVRKLA